MSIDALTDLRAEAARARELEFERDDLRKELDAAHLRELASKGDALAARHEARQLEAALSVALPAWQEATHPKPPRGSFDDAMRDAFAAYLAGDESDRRD